MTGNSSKLLLLLSAADQKIVVLGHQKGEIENRRNHLQSEIKRHRQLVEEKTTRQQDSITRQGSEEHRLKEEEKKIIERRKQLTAMGGAKAAKLVEREIDIATKALQTLEDRLLRAIEEVDKVEGELARHKAELEALEAQYETEASGTEEHLTLLITEIRTLESDRKEVIEQLDDRYRDLYLRLRTKYPAGSVAVAEGGSCRSCFRSLPNQIFNQVLAGALLIQCPGCSRILVATAPEAEGDSADAAK